MLKVKSAALGFDRTFINDADARAVFYWLARRSPDARLTTAPQINGKDVPDYIVDTAKVLRGADRLVQAIKLIRSHMGVSLKEAKDFVDGL